MTNTLPTPEERGWRTRRKSRGSQRKIRLSYMWVAVFLASCSGGGNTRVRWSFADHRTCAEANVVTIVVRDSKERARVACDDTDVGVEVTGVDETIVVEASGYHATVLYRGHAIVNDATTNVVLRYVGGRSD